MYLKCWTADVLSNETSSVKHGKLKAQKFGLPTRSDANS